MEDAPDGDWSCPNCVMHGPQASRYPKAAPAAPKTKTQQNWVDEALELPEIVDESDLYVDEEPLGDPLEADDSIIIDPNSVEEIQDPEMYYDSPVEEVPEPEVYYDSPKKKSRVSNSSITSSHFKGVRIPCPECSKEIDRKSIVRHVREQHGKVFSIPKVENSGIKKTKKKVKSSRVRCPNCNLNVERKSLDSHMRDCYDEMPEIAYE